MFKRFLVLITFIVLMSIPVLAEEEKEAVNPKHQLGLVASSTYGVGLNYQRLLGNKYRLGSSGFVYGYYDKDSGDRDFDGNIGLNLQRNFYRTESYRFYGVVGGQFFSVYNSYIQKNSMVDGVDRRVNKWDFSWAGGMGIGIDLILEERVSLFCDFGLTYLQSDSGDTFWLGPGGSLGFGFLF